MITAQVEAFSAVIEEAKPLLVEHWKELGIYKDAMPLVPMWGEYARLEAAGAVLVTTLRHAGALVGYFCGIITPGLHYGETLTCKMDICYVRPDLRRGGAGHQIFSAVKAELVRRGVKLWWVGSKDHHPIEGFYAAFGFERQETYFSMWLGGEG